MSNEVVKRKAGRPKGQTMAETAVIREHRKLLKFETYLEDINKEIASLRQSVETGKASPAVIGASKAIIHARLALINKVVPDLKAHEHTGNLQHDHKHQVEKISETELAMRIGLFRQQQQARPPIDITPEKQAQAIVGSIVKPKTGEIVQGEEAVLVKPDEEEHSFI